MITRITTQSVTSRKSLFLSDRPLVFIVLFTIFLFPPLLLLPFSFPSLEPLPFLLISFVFIVLRSRFSSANFQTKLTSSDIFPAILLTMISNMILTTVLNSPTAVE